MPLPDHINAAVTTWLANYAGANIRAGADAMSRSYRSGQSSAAVDIGAYLTVRAPATYAAIHRALQYAAEAMPGMSPGSVLDICAGPGTASWAAHDLFPGVAATTMIDRDRRFLDVAQDIAAQAAINATTLAADLHAPITHKADLVIAAYCMVEFPEASAARAALNVWNATRQTLLLVEPGTPEGFRRLRAARNVLLANGAHVTAPCTHANACPMQGDDWCHFTVRLARSRAHMHAKQADVPFEDEPFSYLAVSRMPVNMNAARILARPTETKFSRSFKLCGSQGLTNHTVATRDKSAYKQARKLEWGDAFALNPED